MAFPVYSVNLCRATGASVTASTPVPAGKVIIVRDIDVVASGAGGTVLFEASESVSGALFDFVDETVATFLVHQWRGRQVFVEGETVKFVATASGGVSVSASGYLLVAA